MASKKITELPDADLPLVGVEYMELVQGGVNKKAPTSSVPSSITREFDRAFSSELLFDKNEIEGELYVQDAEITFTVFESGNLTDQSSVYGQRITTDGVNPINFVGFNHLSNISSGEVLDAGTYQFIFWYSNGITRGTVMLPSEEVVNLTPLAAPGSFDAVASGETQINLTWANVTNNVGYRIDVSLDGSTGWSALITTAIDAVSYSHTGLSASSQRFYRITALGNGVTFSNSPYSTDNATTSDAGDVTAPTFTFSPADAATDISVNVPIVITASEPLIDDDGVTVITSANVADYIVLKVDNGAGANIPFTATIDAGKTIITVTPNVVYPSLDNVFVQIDGVEDVNGNESTADDATFATSDYTEMEANYLDLGQQINSVVTGDDKKFTLKIDLKDLVTTPGIFRGMFQKFDTNNNQRSLIVGNNGNDVSFIFYWRTTGSTFSAREIVWDEALAGFTEGNLEFEYDGTIDTNNGLDRVKFYIDGVEITAGKSLVVTGVHTWPFGIYAGVLAPFYLSGPTLRLARNFEVIDDVAVTTVVNIPIIRTGTDVSGNSFDGTWI